MSDRDGPLNNHGTAIPTALLFQTANPCRLRWVAQRHLTPMVTNLTQWLRPEQRYWVSGGGHGNIASPTLRRHCSTTTVTAAPCLVLIKIRNDSLRKQNTYENVTGNEDQGSIDPS